MAIAALRGSGRLNLLWIPFAMQDAALMAIAVPAVLLRLAPENHTALLAIFATLAAAMTMIIPPIAGAMSDTLRKRGQGRRAIVLGGAAINVAGLIAMAQVTTVRDLGIALGVAMIGSNASSAAYQALLPDLVPRSAWGTASGVRGVATLLGTVIGLAIAGTSTPSITLLATAGVLIVGAATIFSVYEGKAPSAVDHAQVRDWHDFVVVLIARALVVFGLTLLMTFVLYFFQDILHDANPSAGTSLVAGASLIGAIISSVLLGTLSDRASRRVITALAHIPMAIAAFGFALFPSEKWMLVFAIAFGFGYGGVLSTGWALAIDAMPALGDVARDLGIWVLVSHVPSVLAPGLGGFILARLGSTTIAYQIIFALAGVSFAIGGAVVLAVRGPRPAPDAILPA